MEQLLTTGDAARRLGVSTEFIRKLVRAGRLPEVRTKGGQHIFSASDVEGLAVERSNKQRAKRKAAAAMKV